MTAGTRWSLTIRVARYLLFATVALLVIDAGYDVLSRSATHWLTAFVVVTFASLAGLRYLFRPDGIPLDRLSVDRAVPSGRWVVLGLSSLLIVGALLRGYALGDQSFWFDEAITANAAIALLEQGQPTFPSGYTYWRGFPHTVVVAGSMALFGTGEAAARLPSVAFGVATIVATYWLGRHVGGRDVGLVAATLVTFLTWEIAWSRQARMYQQFQLLYTLSVVLLFRVEEDWFRDRREVAAFAGVTVLAASTHQIGYVLLPVTAVYLGSAAAFDGRFTRTTAIGALGGSAIITVALGVVGGGVWDVLGGVSSGEFDYLSEYVGWLTTELGAVFFLGLVGASLTFYRGRYRAGTLLLLSVVPATWVLSTRVELFATRYLYFGVPVLVVWTAVTITYVAGEAVEWADSREPASARSSIAGSVLSPTIVAAAIGIVGLLALGGGFTAVPQAEYGLGTNAPQPDFQSAYEYVNEHREPDDVIVAGWTAPGVYYAGEVHYWMAHDLTGSGGRWTVNGRDRYAGAAPVRGADELRGVEAEPGGMWLVADDLTLQRQPRELRRWIESNSRCQRREAGVTVYLFAGSDREEFCPGPSTQ